MRRRAAISLLCVGAAVAGLGLRPAQGAEFDPRSLGIELAAGKVRPGESQAVLTTDEAGTAVVGQVHVWVGSGAMVLLPDGQLAPRTAEQVERTERKFEPLAAAEVMARLKEEQPSAKITKTNHYIYVSSASEEFTLATSRILETMLPGVKGYFDQQKIPVHEPSLPLVVVMFKTEEDFQRHRRMPEGVAAYYDTLSNRVYLYEQSKLAQVRPDLAVQQAISTIAHEGVHQILHNIGVQQRLSVWPMWLSEGLAEFFAPTSTGTRLRWKGPGQVNDLRMFELEQYVKSNSATGSDGKLVEHTVIGAQLTSTGYASAWALTHFLARQRKPAFTALLREVSELAPFTGATNVSPGGIVRENREMFVRHFGDDFPDLEAKLIAHLKKQPYLDPFKDLPHYVAMLTASDGRRPQTSASTFHSPQLAAKWLRDSIRQLPEAQRASAQSAVREFPNRLQAEIFARQWRGR